MNTKKIPMRLCISCRQMKSKKDLIRIVKNNNGEIVFDSTGKLSGRGAYICKDTVCFENARKRKALDKVFEQKIQDEVYDNIRKELEK